MKKLLFIFLFPFFCFGQSDTILTDETSGFFLSTNNNFDTLLVASISGGWNPTDIAGCKLWLDAGQGITKDGGNYVSNWVDESLTGNDMSQATEANQPLWVDAQINGLPILRFDGATEYLLKSSPVNIDLYSGGSVFVVFKSSDYIGNIINNGVDYGTYYGWCCSIDQWDAAFNGCFFVYGSSGYEQNATGTSLADGYFNLFEITHSSVDGTTLYKNAAYLDNNAYKPIGTNTGECFIAKGIGENNYNYLACDIAEIIIYDTALGTTDRQTCENYLMTKYGLP